jgi:transcriptional regulator with XRE-family HTH domain
MEKKDWILDNIRTIIKMKGIKLSNLGQELGKSQGEISKILNGERENYTDFLPQIAKSLSVPFHELVQNNSVNLNNYGEVKDQGVGNVHTLNKADASLYEDRLKDKDEVIATEREQKLAEREQKEYWKSKYYRLKEKLPKS